MGFSDVLGDAWDALHDAGGDALGLTMDTAKAYSSEYSYGRSAKAVTSSFNERRQSYMRDHRTLAAIAGVAGDTVNGGISALTTAYRYGAARPISTVTEAKGNLSPIAWLPGNPTDNRKRPSLSKAWKNSDKVSPGQATALNLGLAPTGATFQNVYKYGEKGNNKFDASFSLWSGTIDAGIAWYMDPLVIGGKAIKVGKEAARLGNADVAAVAGRVAKPSLHQKRIINETEDFIKATDGMDAYSINLMLRRKGANNAAALSDLFAQASGEHALKRTIWLAAAGDKASLETLRGQRASLAGQIDRMAMDLDEQILPFSTEGTLFEANNSQQALIDARNELNDTLTKYDRILGNDDKLAESASNRAIVTQDDLGVFGSMLKTRTKVTRMDKRRIEGAKQYTIQDGVAGIPVRVLRAPINLRPSGWVDFHDADQGIRELEAMTRRVPGLDPDTRVEMMNRYLRAPDDNSRRLTLQHIEHDLVQHMGRSLGYDDADILAIARRAMTEREKAVTHFKQTNFGFAEDGTVLHRPLMETQLANGAPTLDMSLIHKVLKRNASRYRAIKLGAGKGFDVLEHMGDTLNDVWKFTALFRLGYVLRNATDSQLRMLAYLGGQQTTITQLDNVATVARNIRKGGDKFGQGELKIGPYTVGDARGVTADEVRFHNKSITAANSYANQVTEEANRLLNEFRGSGNWKTLRGDDDLYNEHYLRVVNQHFRQSEIAQRLLKGESPDRVVAWLKSAKGRHIRRRMVFGSDSAENLVQANLVNMEHVLPREFWPELARRPFNNADVERIWPRSSALPEMGRPPINAEQIGFSLGKGPVPEAYAKIRDKYFDIVSRATDDQMGRHPLYRALYRGRMKESMMRADPSMSGVLNATDQRILEEQARIWAKREMKSIMFDVSQKSDLAHFVRFIMPFYAAWQDAVTKYSRLIVRDPSLLPRFGTAWTAPNDASFIEVVDENGKPVPSDKSVLGDGEFVRIPAKWAKLFGAQGFSADISKASFNIALQGDPIWAPGWGPIGQVPANEFVKRTDNADIAQAFSDLGILPFGVEDAGKLSWKKFLAGSIRQAGLPEARKTRMKTLILQQELFRYQTGERKTEPTAKEINDRFNGLLRLRWATSALSPVSIQYKSPYQFYIDQSHAYDAKYAGQPGKADLEFYKDFGEDYYLFRASMSKDNTHIRPTRQADRAARGLKDLIAKAPDYGWFFVGPDNTGEYDRNVYTLQSMRRVSPLSEDTYRDTYTDPKEAFKRNNAELGWIQYQKLSAELESIRIDRGLKNMRVKGAEDLRRIKAQWIEKITGPDGPNWGNDWYDDYRSLDSNTTVKFLRAAKLATTDPRIKDRHDIVTMNQYLQARAQFRKLLQQRKAAGGSGSILTEANSDLKTYWDNVTGTLVDRDPIFADVFSRYLERDDLTGQVN